MLLTIFAVITVILLVGAVLVSVYFAGDSGGHGQGEYLGNAAVFALFAAFGIVALVVS